MELNYKRKSLYKFFRLRYLIPVILFFVLTGRTFQINKKFSFKKEKLKNEINSLNNEQRKWEHIFKYGEILYNVLLWKANLPPSISLQFIDSFKKTLDPKKIKEGDRIVISFKGEEVEKISFLQKDIPIQEIVFIKDSSGFKEGERIILPHRKELSLVRGSIEENLFLTFDSIPQGTYLAARVAEIFSFDIDFNTEIRSGDSFQILLEKFYIDNKFHHYGEIIYVSFKGKYFGLKEAFLFKSDQKKGDYYSRKGESLKKGFLRSPLPFGRITSKFSKKRFHPILRVWRPHHGVDYSAPIGTPVQSIGNGICLYAGWKSGYGNYVLIKHFNGYTTGYAHLSKIKKTLRKGKKVKIGEIIGYVGNTGLSTGAHLHFEIKKNGKFKNFLNISFPPYKVLQGKLYESFQKVIEEVDLLRKKLEKRIEIAYRKNLKKEMKSCIF